LIETTPKPTHAATDDSHNDSHNKVDAAIYININTWYIHDNDNASAGNAGTVRAYTTI